jgi:rhodanese-related sulfurtransferase
MKVIGAKGALKKHEGGARLIDVRTPIEFRSEHASGAEWHELRRLGPEYINDPGFSSDRERELVFLCKVGVRARKAAERFEAEGFRNVSVVEGGTDAWVKSGLPAERGEEGVSLERQVRITAGGFVFLGTALGVFLSPYFLIIPAFFGAGLFHSGVTNTCAMAMLLTRMPWNR